MYSFCPERQGCWWKGTKQIHIHTKEVELSLGGHLAFKPKSIPSPLSQMHTEPAHRAKLPKVVFKELSNICAGLYVSHKDFSLPTTLHIQRGWCVFVYSFQGSTEIGRTVWKVSLKAPAGNTGYRKKRLNVIISTHTHTHMSWRPKHRLPRAGQAEWTEFE